MRKLVLTAVLFLALTPAGATAAEKDIENIPSCQYCGMDREKFGATRVLVEYETGAQIGTCSIHCAAVDLAQSFTKALKGIHVADQSSLKLVDAEKAVWLIGANVPGVMSKTSRLAFADRADAEAFKAEHGGEITDFTGAINSTYADMWADTQMIRSKRAGGKMKMK